MDSLISLLNQKVATPGQNYEVSGDTFNLMKRLFTALWRGENIGNSTTVTVQQNGPAGIILKGAAAAATAASSGQTNYLVFDQSALTPGFPSIGITPGNHYDSTGSATWIPTINDFTYGYTAINATVGSPARAPALKISPSATMAYFKQTVKPRDGSGASPAGAIDSSVAGPEGPFEIDADSGAGLPTPNTNTILYTICQFLKVNGPDGSGNYTVTNLYGGVLGSQVYQQCGGGTSGNRGSPLYGLQ